MQDFLSDVEELDALLSGLKFLGCRGTTGTEASFMDLFDGDEEKIDEMNRRIAAEFGFSECFPVCGQTYPRKVDSRILSCLSSIAQSAYRMAGDIRLLQHDRQLEEPFEDSQIGSSAMAYKRNPMRCERICSLSRCLMADAMNAPMTASTQWLERTLDDSANRRIALPEGFLCADAILRLCQNVASGLRVNETVVDRTLREYLPFMATENLMMEAVKRGGDRQQLHEVIRRHSMAATARMKEGHPCDLLDRLAADPAFGLTRPELEALMDPQRYISTLSPAGGPVLRALPAPSGAGPNRRRHHHPLRPTPPYFVCRKTAFPARLQHRKAAPYRTPHSSALHSARLFLPYPNGTPETTKTRPSGPAGGSGFHPPQRGSPPASPEGFLLYLHSLIRRWFRRCR